MTGKTKRKEAERVTGLSVKRKLSLCKDLEQQKTTEELFLQGKQGSNNWQLPPRCSDTITERILGEARRETMGCLGNHRLNKRYPY